MESSARANTKCSTLAMVKGKQLQRERERKINIFAMLLLRQHELEHFVNNGTRIDARKQNDNTNTKCLKEVLSKWIHISLLKCARMYFVLPNPLCYFMWAMRKHLQHTKTHLQRTSERAREQDTPQNSYMWKFISTSVPFLFLGLPHRNDNSSLAITIRCSKLVVIWQRLTMSIRCRYRCISASWFKRM